MTLVALVLGFVLWAARGIPLSGVRRLIATTCRMLLMAVLCAAFVGFSRRITSREPQHVVYLVDGSASID